MRIQVLIVHGMGGIKSAEVAEYLRLDPKQSEVLMGFTIGQLADLSQLDDQQRENETPNIRKDLSEVWHSV